MAALRRAPRATVRGWSRPERPPAMIWLARCGVLDQSMTMPTDMAMTDETLQHAMGVNTGQELAARKRRAVNV